MQKVDLSEVLEKLINEERDEATGLVHEWIVQMSKSVHESLMAEDDAAQDIADDQEAIESEEFYGEAEEDDAEAGEDAGEEMADDAAEDTVEVSKADLEAVMANLQAEFAAIMGEEGDDAEADMDMDMDMDMDADAEVDADEEEFAVESDELEEDEFADLEESFKLEPVADPAMEDGKEIGKGGKVTQNKKSGLPTGKPDHTAAHAVEIKAEEHKGFEREAAPEVKAKPLLKNQVKKADADLCAVSKEGDKSAMLNKKDGFGTDSPMSPLSGLKKGK